jgi:hypothetical protein
MKLRLIFKKDRGQETMTLVIFFEGANQGAIEDRKRLKLS